MKTNPCSLGLILGLALAPLALAAPAQRGPATGGPNSNPGSGYGTGSTACAGVCDATCPGGEDLVNLAVAETLLHGGTVFPAASRELPAQSPMAAVFRY